MKIDVYLCTQSDFKMAFDAMPIFCFSFGEHLGKQKTFSNWAMTQKNGCRTNHIVTCNSRSVPWASESIVQ